MTAHPAALAPTSPAPTGRRPVLLLKPSTWPRWAREPLVHFLVLGALVFVVDHALVGDGQHTIVVGPEVDAEAKRIFRQSRGREPSAEELFALRRVWLDNEVLYREGLALQVDKGDDAIRERVIFKALSVVDAGTKLPRIDDGGLRAWFDAHRAKYDEPQRYDFDEAVLAGDRSEAAMRDFVASLNSGTPGDARAGLRVFKGRPHANLVQGYGEEFARTLEALPTGSWQAVQTKDGWRAMRLVAVTATKPAVFEPLRPVVLQDWTDATLAEQRSASVQSLARKYVVRVEGDPR